ncbi:MAG: ABC transporter permease, partial [Trebonia sp.]
MSTAATQPPAAVRLPRLRAGELIGTALQGLRTRRLRAALSALGIAIGIAAMIAVVGISSSAQANLLAEIDALGTNLLTATPAQTITGQGEIFPATATAQIAHQPGVIDDVAVYQLTAANVYRNPYVPAEQTGGLSVDATGENLPRVLGTTIASGHFLDTISQRYPEAVLGAQAAQILNITYPGVLIDLANRWFTVIGIMRSAALDTTLDSTVLISLPVAEQTFQLPANPSQIYIRTNQNQVTNVANRLPASTDPQDPSAVNISRPSDALEARAAAKGQFTTLLLGLGAVALLVGAIGIANIMVISVLERRGEIGLRRALGATQR